eukprot:gene10872-biopygen15369
MSGRRFAYNTICETFAHINGWCTLLRTQPSLHHCAAISLPPHCKFYHRVALAPCVKVTCLLCVNDTSSESMTPPASAASVGTRHAQGMNCGTPVDILSPQTLESLLRTPCSPLSQGLSFSRLR